MGKRVVRPPFTGATHDKEGLFQAADGGTLFLDEIGNTPRELQSREQIRYRMRKYGISAGNIQ